MPVGIAVGGGTSVNEQVIDLVKAGKSENACKIKTVPMNGM
jgi:hypothetical protein